MVQKLEELDVYTKAIEFCASVNAILERPGLRRNRKLHDQIDEANDSITSNLSEGFEQSSDAGFANYLYHSKASAAEVIARLRQCRVKGYISEEELRTRLNAGEQLTRMIAGLIKHLKRCDWRDRGRFQPEEARKLSTAERRGTKDRDR